MGFELKDGMHSLELTLSGRLGVQQAASLWAAVQPAIANRSKVRLLAGELDEMDTSIIQILCRLGDGRAASMQIAQVSDGFIRSLKRSGLEKFFVRNATPNRGATEVASSEPSGPPPHDPTVETVLETLPDPAQGAVAAPAKKRSTAKTTSGSRLSA